MSYEVLLLLFFIAALAGFVDAIAGGGGLLTIPALIFAGLTPLQALATNKLQACFGSFSATRHFLRSGLIHLNSAKLWIVTTAIGAAIGTWAVQQIDNQILLAVMPFALIGLALYALFNRNLGHQKTQPTLSRQQYAATIAPAVGAYDGFFGPGTGTFFAMANVKTQGMDFIHATANAKLLNFVTNVVSLSVFAAGGQVVIAAGLSMAVGQLLGARLGAGMVIQKGAGFIRFMTITICIILSISLLYKYAALV